MTPKILEALLQSSLQLKTLILPNKMCCCLCGMKDDTEVLSDTIKLDCTDTCTTNESLCEKDEALNRMQKEVMKALEIRKLNASSTLNIVPEKLLHSNITMKVTVRQRNTNLGELNPHLLKSVQELGKLKPEEVLQIKWNDTSELKKLYMLANLLQMALTEQVMEDKRGRQGEPRQIARRSAWKWSVMQFTTSFPFLTASIMVDNDAADLTGRVLIILKHFNESSHQDHSLHEEETAAPSTTTTPTTTPTTTTTTTTSTTSPTSQSLLLEGTSGSSKNEPSEGNSEQTSDNAPLMAKEALLNQLMHGTQEGGVPQIPGDNAEAPQIPGDDTEASLNEISPDITLSHETHWEHHELKTTARHKLNILPTDDDYLLQGDLFEAELNKRLSPLIPNTPVRNLISHTLRILKMDCTVSRVQLACAKFISRTGLLMKLFSERENLMDNSALWKSYFLSMKNVSNLATGSPRKLGKSEICSQRSAAKHGTPQEKRTFLGRKKKGAEQSSSAGSSVLDKPLWLKDMYQPLDEVRKKSMVDKMHDEESSEDEDIFSWARVPGAPRGPPSPSPVEQPPSRRPSSRKIDGEDRISTGSAFHHLRVVTEKAHHCVATR
ncbi:leucine-rich repeat-containing protein 37A-like isoform X3 [Hemicordylus capensis]|uniref:leucine-rich repeat-containing protein 37A-like isoform X3 n=1 Tax=Hemicordylus capensis TaxID=884348 RepID=UPI002303CAC8|nr:leucine-rich repeat-containing protein 37A-like isoform X3 [Hemicordylus capensis]